MSCFHTTLKYNSKNTFIAQYLICELRSSGIRFFGIALFLYPGPKYQKNIFK